MNLEAVQVQETGRNRRGEGLWAEVRSKNRSSPWKVERHSTRQALEVNGNNALEWKSRDGNEQKARGWQQKIHTPGKKKKKRKRERQRERSNEERFVTALFIFWDWKQKHCFSSCEIHRCDVCSHPPLAPRRQQYCRHLECELSCWKRARYSTYCCWRPRQSYHSGTHLLSPCWLVQNSIWQYF